MKKIKLIVLAALLLCQANLMAQTVTAKFKTVGGKSDQRELKKVFISDFLVKQRTIDVDQEKFLEILKAHPLAAANASIDAWQAELK